MKKNYLLLLILAMLANVSFAQKIDFNQQGRNKEKNTAVGFEPWDNFKRVVENTKKFKIPNSTDSIQITISSVPNVAGSNGLQLHYNKVMVETNGYRLLGDCLDAIYLTNPGESDDHVNPTESAGIQVLVSGFPAGTHSLMCYHNFIDALSTTAKLNVYVDGKLVEEGVAQTSQKWLENQSTTSYVTFDVTGPEQQVAIQYVSQPEAGVVYTNAGVAINCLIFDETNPDFSCVNPSPAADDWHANADNGSLTLSWSPAKRSVNNHIMLGTTSGDLTEVGTTTDSCFTVKDIYTLNTYYWRVDVEDASGKIHKGTEWSFKARQLAFPDAEGFGRFATGGRGGDVYHVTSLADDNTQGTFRHAIKSATGPRTIVFDVSGTIELKSSLANTNKFVTIAGQTAPGKGITLKGSPFTLGSETIGRFLRLRLGYGKESQNDGLNMNGSQHTILDHASMAWTVDVGLDSRNSKDISFQRSMITEALGYGNYKGEGENHGLGSTIGGERSTYNRNLLAHCFKNNWGISGTRNASQILLGQMDIFNNVCYNWGEGTTYGATWQSNFVNNYYKTGAASTKEELFILDFSEVGNQKLTAYVSGNVRENLDKTITEDLEGLTYKYTGEPEHQVFVKEPLFESNAEILPAKDAFKVVCSDVGANLPYFDAQDVRVVNETLNGTYTYTGGESGLPGQIDKETEAGGFEDYGTEARAADFDTDQDGMPNWYEKIIGSDENVANNNDDPNKDGWTLLEDYLEFIAHPYTVLDSNAQAEIDVAKYFRGFTKTPTYTVESLPNFIGATITGSTLTLTSSELGGTGIVTLKVTDSEGSSYSLKYNVAVNGKIAAGLKGDANNDGTVDVADITAIASYILGTTPTAWNADNADVNNDKVIDVADITATAALILSNAKEEK